MTRGVRAGATAGLLGLLGLLVVAGGAAPAGAQTAGSAGGADGAAGPGRPAAAEVFASAQEAEPPMPEAPLQFRVGGTGGGFLWAAPAGGGIEVEDVVMLGAELETILYRYASVRLGTSFGQPRITSPGRTVTADQFLVELSVAGRAARGPWTRWGLVPYVAAGAGTVVHAPDPPDLISENQNQVSFGAGLEWTGFRGFGARLGWRSVEVELGDVFDPQSRGSPDRDADRITGQIFWTF